jgi:ABC-2 type transport system ATP-binding protein
MKMIKIENLYKSYGKNKVLKNLNLEVNKGEIYGFIGQNGQGKSTTMNIIAGLINFNSGKCVINDKDIKNLNANDVGYLPETPSFYNYMNAYEYFNFIGGICGDDKNLIKRKSEELLRKVKLIKAAKKSIGTYSRGMKQRLGVAVAIYNDPEIIILDEPSSALDPEGRKDIIDIIKNLKDMGKTIFISTHILNDIEKICSRIGILKDGKIIIEEDLKNLTKKYINSIYDIEFENSIDKSYVEIFKKLDFVKSIEYIDSKLSIKVKDISENGLFLIKKIADSNLLPLSIEQRKMSLEDIFMEVTNNEYN